MRPLGTFDGTACVRPYYRTKLVIPLETPARNFLNF
jgi:hypothetical protein